MSCYKRQEFIDNPFLEELICPICLEVMIIPILLPCGNGCLIGKGCYKNDMTHCPRCNEKLFYGCDGCSGCCFTSCPDSQQDLEMCSEKCGCNGFELYNDCTHSVCRKCHSRYDSDDLPCEGGCWFKCEPIRSKRCIACKGCWGCDGCSGAKNNTPIVYSLKNIACKMNINCPNVGCNQVFMFEKLDEHKQMCNFMYLL